MAERKEKGSCTKKMDDFYFDSIPLTKEQVRKEIERLKANDKEISAILKKTNVPIIIKECGSGIRALYNIKKKEIWVSDKDVEPGSLKEILLHECIHSYDHTVNKINISTLEGLARTEVHAMKMCECKNAWFKKYCTKTKATKAVSLSLGDYEKAEKAVLDVFDSAYNENFLSGPYD